MKKDSASTGPAKARPQSAAHIYAIALGSNRRHGRHGRPDAVVRAAMLAVGEVGEVTAMSSTHATNPLGPAGRRFANAALMLETSLPPLPLLRALKRIERQFGRRPGRRWGARVLDLDIILWSGGRWRGGGLTIPHPEMARRAFVLAPLAEIAPGWRPPGAALTVRHLAARLRRG